MDWDWVPAEAAAREAVALDPNSAMSHMFLGIVLAQLGNDVEAREVLRRARELDPFFPLMFVNSSNVALYGGDPESAVEFATQAIAIDPEFWPGYRHLGNAELARGNLDAALQAFTDAVRLSGGTSNYDVAFRAFVLARLGRKDEARDILAELTSPLPGRFVQPFFVAAVLAGLGDFDAAFEKLEDALSARDAGLLRLTFLNDLANLETDPRYQSLVRRCGCT